MINGVINVYKEKGFTSHDVVAKLRGILKQKKIGHTGTLDPDAEGVLPVCMGKGTKLCDMLTDKSKEYRAVMRLGIVTDTQDISGTVLAEKNDFSGITEDMIREAVESYVGEYHQIPPMYSALKVNGKKLYELARAGVEVERKPRKVWIHNIIIEEINIPYVQMKVACSKGTYIRTLCHDIGDRLQVGACMESLVRTRVGLFEINDAIKLSDIEKIRDKGELDRIVMPIDRVFQEYQKIIVKSKASAMVYNGNPIQKQQIANIDHINVLTREKYRVYDHRNVFVGIYQYVGNDVFKVEKFFLDV